MTMNKVIELNKDIILYMDDYRIKLTDPCTEGL